MLQMGASEVVCFILTTEGRCFAMAYAEAVHDNPNVINLANLPMQTPTPRPRRNRCTRLS